MSNYQPGEVIRDSGGYEVAVHFIEGGSTSSPIASEVYRDMRKGIIPLEQGIGIAANHLAAAQAYDRGTTLPEGATITQEYASLLGDSTPQA